MATDISVSSYTTPAPAGGTLTYTTQATSGATGSQAKTTKLTAVSPANTAAPTDTVKLSPESQMKLTRQQGHDTRQLADSVGTTDTA